MPTSEHVEGLGTQMRVVVVEPGTDILQQVITLGDRNSKFLGHFPESAFEREAGKGRILAAVSGASRVLGYLLFRTGADRAAVQHLCVDSDSRGKGVGHLLIDDLKERTRYLPAIACHVALEFEDAIKAWKSYGFVPMGEKAGRGAAQRPLILMWFDHGHAHLFSDHRHALATGTLVAALDLNVALAIHESPSTDKEILALTSDWLVEEVSLWITNESMVEIMRKTDTAERRRTIANLRSMRALESRPQEEAEALLELRQLFGPAGRAQDSSDTIQLAQAIAGDADVFLTRDEGILRHADAVEAGLGIRVMRPSDLVVHLDELSRVNDYAPVRLQGSAIAAHLIRQAEIDPVIDQFLNTGVGERRHQLAQVIRTHTSQPGNSQVLVVDGDSAGFRAVMAFSWATGELRIEALRVRRDRLSETLTRHLLSIAIRISVEKRCPVTIVEDPRATHPLESAALQLGFLRGAGGLVKWSCGGIASRGELLDQLRTCVAAQPELMQPLTEVVAIGERDPAMPADDLALERLAWPMLLRGSPLRTFVVPIQPLFATHLFDRGLSGCELFGGDPTLLLNCENVYYRSSRARIVSAPGRILWYVSTDSRAKVQQLRAYSGVLTTEVGSAKDLFRKYRRLGVYEWGQLQEMTDGDPSGQVMAIHFGQTEMLAKPIDGDTLRDLIAVHRKSAGPPPLITPIEIPPACFERIIELSHAK